MSNLPSGGFHTVMIQRLITDVGVGITTEKTVEKFLRALWDYRPPGCRVGMSVTLGVRV